MLIELQERSNSGLHAHVLERVKEVEPRLNASILDFGCGSGALLSQLKSCGYTKLIGIDIDPPTIDGIVMYQADLDEFNLPVKNGSIDLVTIIEVIEHLENLGSLLKHVSTILAPDGSVLLTTPNCHSLEARLRNLLKGELKQFDEKGDPTHVTPIFLHPFQKLLMRHGFKIERLWGFPTNGASPTSALPVRIISRVARTFGLTGSPDGDNLCLVISRSDSQSLSLEQKRLTVTSHYEKS